MEPHNKNERLEFQIDDVLYRNPDVFPTCRDIAELLALHGIHDTYRTVHRRGDLEGRKIEWAYGSSDMGFLAGLESHPRGLEGLETLIAVRQRFGEIVQRAIEDCMEFPSIETIVGVLAKRHGIELSPRTVSRFVDDGSTQINWIQTSPPKDFLRELIGPDPVRILSGKKIYEEKYARLERMVHAICEEHPNDMPTGRKIARWFYGKYEIAINHNVITGNIEIIPLQKAWLLASSDAVFIGTELRVGHEEESQEITDVIKQRFGKIVTAIFLQHLGEYPSLNNMKKWLKERFPKMNHAIQPYVDYLAIQLRWIENCDIEILLRSIRAYTFAPMLRDDERVKLAEKKLGSISESDLARYRGYMGRKRQRGMRLPADGIGGTKQTARLRSVI